MLVDQGIRWVPIAAAAAALKISRQAVRARIEAGSLAGKFVSGIWLVSVASIEAACERKWRGGRANGDGR